MKKLVLALAAAASIGAPMLAATDAAAQGRPGYDRNDNRGRADNRGPAPCYDNRAPQVRYDNRGGYDNRRWDSSRNNGYYLGNRWYYGAPPSAYYGRPDYRPAYRAWTRGSYLPRSYWSYGVSDYRRYNLRQPPRGYHWVRVNNDYVLAAIATGLIYDVITGRY